MSRQAWDPATGNPLRATAGADRYKLCRGSGSPRRGLRPARQALVGTAYTSSTLRARRAAVRNGQVHRRLDRIDPAGATRTGDGKLDVSVVTVRVVPCCGDESSACGGSKTSGETFFHPKSTTRPNYGTGRPPRPAHRRTFRARSTGDGSVRRLEAAGDTSCAAGRPVSGDRLGQPDRQSTDGHAESPVGRRDRSAGTSVTRNALPRIDPRRPPHRWSCIAIEAGKNWGIRARCERPAASSRTGARRAPALNNEAARIEE